MRNFFSKEAEHCYSPEHSYPQLQKACNSCKDIFDRLTKVDNTVTIKMIIDDGTNFITIARNQMGVDTRGTGQKHAINRNTAFSHLVAGNRWFLKNDLQFDSNYINTNSNWKNEYSSTLVVPIRMNEVLVGCLAVDSFKKENVMTASNQKGQINEIYNDKNHVQLLAIFADLIYCVISKTIEFSQEIDES